MITRINTALSFQKNPKGLPFRYIKLASEEQTCIQSAVEHDSFLKSKIEEFGSKGFNFVFMREQGKEHSIHLFLEKINPRRIKPVKPFKPIKNIADAKELLNACIAEGIAFIGG